MVAAVGSRASTRTAAAATPAPAAAARAGAEAAGTRPGSGALEVEARVIAAAPGGFPDFKRDGSPSRSNPTLTETPAPGAGAGFLPGPSTATSRPELRHREVPGPDLPLADLPGRRHPVRHPLGGAGGDQRDRDRLRPQPERLLRRRARLDAVHPLHLARLRRRRQQGRREGPLQPGRRDLRRRSLPRRPPAAEQDLRARDLRLQPRRLVRRLGDDAGAADRGLPATWSARSPASPRAASRSPRGPLRRRPRRSARPTSSASTAGQNAANLVEDDDTRRAIDIFTRESSPGRRRQRRRDQEDRQRAASSAASSSSRTSTATATPTRGLGSRSPQLYPVPKRQDASARRKPLDADAEADQTRRVGRPSRTERATAKRGNRPRRRRSAAAPRPRPADQGAPVRPPRRARTRSQDGGDEQHQPPGAAPSMRRSSHLQRLFRRRPTVFVSPGNARLKLLQKGSHVIAGTVLGRVGYARRRPRARTSTSRSGPPAAAPRGSTRSRSSTAGSCSRRPRSTAPSGQNVLQGGTSVGQVLLMSEAAAREARARRQAHRDLRLRAPGHPDRPDRPPRARHALLPRRVRAAPDRHVA